MTNPLPPPNARHMPRAWRQDSPNRTEFGGRLADDSGDLRCPDRRFFCRLQASLAGLLALATDGAERLRRPGALGVGPASSGRVARDALAVDAAGGTTLEARITKSVGVT